jgi:hypothetical protein
MDRNISEGASSGLAALDISYILLKLKVPNIVKNRRIL